MEWISVEDRLPEEHELVLIYSNLWDFTASYDKKHGWIFYDPRNPDHALSGTDNVNVTHWMPLPEPPKED